MDLILLQKVVNLGGLGDKVSVKPGYGRNFLVPQGKAVAATAANLEAAETTSSSASMRARVSVRTTISPPQTRKDESCGRCWGTA